MFVWFGMLIYDLFTKHIYKVSKYRIIDLKLLKYSMIYVSNKTAKPILMTDVG